MGSVITKLNATFIKLNSPQLETRQNVSTKDRRIVLDLIIDGSATAPKYNTDGIPMDVSQFRGFRKIYGINVINQIKLASANVIYRPNIDADNSASTFKLMKIIASTGLEVADDTDLITDTVTIEFYGR